jgi:hypothetical protein
VIYQPHMEKSDWSEFTAMVQVRVRQKARETECDLDSYLLSFSRFSRQDDHSVEFES